MSGSGKLLEDVTDDLSVGDKVLIIMQKAQEEHEAEQARRLGLKLDAEERAAKEKEAGLNIPSQAEIQAKKKADDEWLKEYRAVQKASWAELNAYKAMKAEKAKEERKRLAEEKKARALEAKAKRAEKVAAKEADIKAKRAPVTDTRKRTRAASKSLVDPLSSVPKKRRTETLVEDTTKPAKKTKKQLQEEEEAEWRAEAELKMKHNVLCKEFYDLLCKKNTATGAEKEAISKRIEELRPHVFVTTSGPKDAREQVQIWKKDKAINEELHELLKREEKAVGDEKAVLIMQMELLAP